MTRQTPAHALIPAVELARDLGLATNTLAAYCRRQGWVRVAGRWRLTDEQAANARAHFEERIAAATAEECRAEGCSSAPGTRGYCGAHYRRLQRHGDPNAVVGRGSANAAKTTCPAGHPYTAANTLRFSDGRRRCAKCRRRQSRASGSRPEGTP